MAALAFETPLKADPVEKGPACLFKNPHRLVSLWDIMDDFNVDGLSRILALLTEVNQAMSMRRERCGDTVLPDDVKGWYHRIALEVVDTCRSVKFLNCQDQVEFALASVLSKQGSTTGMAETAIEQVRYLMGFETTKWKFVPIPPDRVEYFNQNDLFGANVSEAFPSASADIKEGGNCLAVDSPTAAVFHFMRAAEYGLRALAIDRRIKLPKKGSVIELATWEDIILELEKAEKAIQGYHRTIARESQFQFYHGAMMEFKRF